MSTKEYDELKRRRDKAALEYVRARDAADELEEAVKPFEQFHNVKVATWERLADNLQRQFDKNLLEVNRLKHEVELLSDDNQVFIAAETKKGDQLTESEKQDAKNVAAKAANECRTQIESLMNRINLLHEEVESAKKAVDEAKLKLNVARQKADKASDDADKLEDDAIGLEETTTKVRCWLRWDGMVTDKGDSNKSHGESKTSKAAAARRNTSLTKEEIAKRVDLKVVDEVHSKLSESKVSVRIESCSDSFAPIHERAAVGIDLKRSNLINSLLFRVYDKDGTTVYQEILDADQIDKLPRSRARATRHTKSFQDRYDSAIAVAGPEKAPYTFGVWISTNKNAFANLATVNKPKETSNVQVHDRTARSDNSLLKSGAGVNQTTPKKIRMVATAQMVVATAHDNKTRNEQTIKSKVLEIGGALIEADKAFKRDALDGEIRLFLAPEWNFQTEDTAKEHLYTAKQRDSIIDELKTLSKHGSSWLICPGTILWEMKNKDLGITAAFNTVIFVADGKEVFRYHKKNFGSDTSISITPFELKASFNEQRHVTLNNGKLPESIQAALLARNVGTPKSLASASVTTLEKDKRWKATVEKSNFIIFEPAHKLKTVVGEVFWANDLDDNMWNRCMPKGVNHTDYLLSHYFTYRGLKLGVEICADHRTGCAAMEFPNVQGVGRGTGNTAGVDIHAISAYYVDLTRWKSVARSGGYVLHCDGSTEKGDVLRVTNRNHAISQVAHVCTESRAYLKKEEKQSLLEKRPFKFVRPIPPGTVNAPAVVMEVEEPQIIQMNGYKLHLNRLVLVDP